MTFSNKRIVQTSKALSVVALIAILSVVALHVRYVVMKPIQSIVNQGDGLEYIDYNNPITSIATAIKIHQEVAYVGLADRLLIYDVSNGDAPIYIGGSEKLCRVQGGSECIISDIEVAEENLYVAISNWIPPVNDSGAVSVPPSTEYYQSHIIIFNVVAPTKPEIVGWAPVTGGAADIEIHNNRMFVASAGEGISVFVLQNGHGTQFIGSLQLGNARNLARRGEYLFVTIEGDVPSDFGASASGGNAHAGNQISESRVVVA